MAGGNDNLIPLNERTKEEQRTVQVMGGKASGEARRRKKSMREAAEAIMAQMATADRAKEVLEAMGAEDKDYQTAVVCAMVIEAISGNVSAANSIRDLLGENPAQSVTLNHNTGKLDAILEQMKK